MSDQQQPHQPPNGSPLRLLIIGPAWIGDMVMAQCLFKILKKRHPHAQIDVAAPAWTLPLLERMPEVSKAIALPFAHGEFALLKRIRLGRSWVKDAYDWAMVLPNSWKSAVMTAAAGIAKRTAWLGEMRWGLVNDLRRLDKQRWSLMIERFMALAIASDDELPKPYPQPKLEIDAKVAEKLAREHGLSADKPILALCPGAEFGPSKRWPASYYAEVAQKKIADAWQVVLFGSPKEQAVADVILQKVPACIDLVGKTSLGEAIDLLSLADWVVCNDSGLMHIAAALDRRVIAIYGSTSPRFTPPLSHKVQLLQLNLPCQPCFKRDCPLKHHKCMRDILPGSVLDVLTVS